MNAAVLLDIYKCALYLLISPKYLELAFTVNVIVGIQSLYDGHGQV